MGIDVESYRARIGTFIRKKSNYSESEKRLRTAVRLKNMWIMKYCTNQVSYTSPYWNSYKVAKEKDHYPLKQLQVQVRVYIIIQRCQGVYIYICYYLQLVHTPQGQAVPVISRRAGKVLLMMVVASVVAIVRLLLVMSGDVEENPGPLGQHTKGEGNMSLLKL